MNKTGTFTEIGKDGLLSSDVPTRVKTLYHPSIVMFRTRPRRWVFQCACCERDVTAFGWFGYARCPFCRQQHAPKWEFPSTGY